MLKWLLGLMLADDADEEAAVREELAKARKREQYYDLQGANFRSVMVAHSRVEELEEQLSRIEGRKR